jgi:arylsulfatase A-like enzyme
VHTARVRRVAPSVVVFGTPLLGALYLAAHTLLAAVVASRDRTIQGIEAADLTRAIETRFSADILATGQLLLCSSLLIGLALGVAAGLLVSLRAHLRRQRPGLAALGVALVGLHLAAWSLSLVHRPQLYASFLYDPGGLRRLICVLFTDVLGFWGTSAAWLIATLIFLFGPIYRRTARAPWRRFLRLVSRRGPLLAIVAAAISVATIFPLSTSVRREDPRRPNVLILAADSLRPDRVDDRRAPTLARFAREAVIFDRAHVTIARTFPSWVTILTGRYPHDHGIRTMFPTREARSRDFDALPQRFTQAGYRSFVASDFAGDIFPRIRLGFQSVDAPNFHFGQVIRQRGIEAQPALLPFLDTRVGRALVPTMRELNRAADADDVARRTLAAIDERGDHPFFGVAFFSTTHFPYAAPDPGYRAFTDRAYRGRFKYEKVNRLGRDAPPDAGDIEQIRGLYDGAVRVVDDGARRVLRGLEARGLAENTIVVVLADHGEDLFEGARGHGHGDHLFGEESSHVPLLIRDGRRPTAPSRHVGGLVRDVDLAPTLYALAGLSPPDDLAGRSLDKAMDGAPLEPLPAFAETGVWFTQDVPGVSADMRLPYPEIPFLTEVLRGQGEDIVLRQSYEPTIVMAKHRSIVRDTHKLVLLPTRTGLKTMLFDLARDPACLVDRSLEDPARTAQLRAELLAWVLEDRRLELRGDNLLPKPKAFGAGAADSTVVRFDGP